MLLQTIYLARQHRLLALVLRNSGLELARDARLLSAQLVHLSSLRLGDVALSLGLDELELKRLKLPLRLRFCTRGGGLRRRGIGEWGRTLGAGCQHRPSSHESASLIHKHRH